MTMGEYEIRLYDTPLVQFRFLDDGGVAFVGANGAGEKMFPAGLECTDAGIEEWLQHRVISKNRAFVNEILRSLGLEEKDMKGIIDVCKGLSLNDSYWVVPCGFDGKFADFNLYQNPFSEVLSLVAYTGTPQGHVVISTSPELTTGGMLPKAWRQVDGDLYLYKGGTSGAANAGNEPYSEFYASQIAQRMDLNAVTYDLERWKDILASKCKLFTSIDMSYVSMGTVVRSGGLDAVMKHLSDTMGAMAYSAACSMIVFDSLIYNQDRHFGNFGLLRDSRSGEYRGFAPLFDHGLSLFCQGMASDFKDVAAYAKTLVPAVGIRSFDQLAMRYMGKLQVSQLRKMIGFRFERHERYNLPEERLVAIEGFVQQRIRRLLDIAKEKDRREELTF